MGKLDGRGGGEGTAWTELMLAPKEILTEKLEVTTTRRGQF